MACQRSQSICNPSQKSADIPTTCASRSAVSDVIERLPRMISLSRGNEIPRRIANSDWVMPNGLTNSSSNISPGRVGGRWRGSRRVTRARERPGESVVTGLLVIIRDLNLVDISSLPSKTDPILIIDSDTVLPAPVRAQPFEAISWWYGQLSEIFHAIHLVEFPSGHLPQISRTRFSGHLGIDAVKYCLGASIPERAYHGCHYNGTRSRPSIVINDRGRFALIPILNRHPPNATGSWTHGYDVAHLVMAASSGRRKRRSPSWRALD